MMVMRRTLLGVMVLVAHIGACEGGCRDKDNMETFDSSIASKYTSEDSKIGTTLGKMKEDVENIYAIEEENIKMMKALTAISGENAMKMTSILHFTKQERTIRSGYRTLSLISQSKEEGR